MTAGHPHAVPVPAGYRVGSWEVREPLASGAFGTVYAARRTGGGEPDQPRQAALKFLPTGTHTPRRLRHLRELADREVDLLRRLRSPRLIRMYDVLTVDDPALPELDGATVLVLEQAEGSLEELLRRTPVPGSGPALLAQVCEGLHQLHHAGWVHGDLKPGNVLLMKDGSVRLADFNMAAELEGTHAYSPAFSTPDYTPPELLWPELGERGRQIRPTADIWAFGVLAHLVLTDSYPLPGGSTDARCDAAVRYARGTEELRLSPRLPEAWREIVTDCLARSHDLRAAHDSASLLRRAEQAAGEARSARLPRLRPRRPRRSAWVATLAGTLAATAAAVAVTYATLRDDGPTYGYHRCPAGSVCFFSEEFGNGEMCDWADDDPDWLSGDETCAWTRDRPVRSIFNNGVEAPGRGGVAYYRGTDFTAAGIDRTRMEQRTGCTSMRQQGNLAGTYAPRSHEWVPNC
ncbi:MULTISPECIES: protein kinase [Streptomyces]|uniref:Protein kinase n=1 Tax=Streptomyces lycii TaxID=2654337 RepID=A0ABQ7FEZ8_9ACTN|nr:MULTISPECIES: protein kinase [Streptomyces]KAF4406249.1 protein kinase [Streptomyces lycii]